MLSTSILFRSFQIYSTGINSRNKSKIYFFQGFHSVFKDYLESNFSKEHVEEIKEIMYGNFRCGLYHTGFTKNKITLGEHDRPINAVLQLDDNNSSYKVINIEIDATKMIYAVESHLENYLLDLHNPNNKEIRDRFLQGFKELYKF